jgi:hypothetical protein
MTEQQMGMFAQTKATLNQELRQAWLVSPMHIMLGLGMNQIYCNLSKVPALLPRDHSDIEDWNMVDPVTNPAGTEPNLEGDYIDLRGNVLLALEESIQSRADVFSIVAMGRPGSAKGQLLMGYLWLFNHDPFIKEQLKKNLKSEKKGLRVISIGPLGVYAEVLKEEGELSKELESGDYTSVEYSQISNRAWRDIEHDIINDPRYVTILLAESSGPTCLPNGTGIDRFNSVGYRLLTNPQTSPNAKLYMIEQEPEVKEWVIERRRKVRETTPSSAATIFAKQEQMDILIMGPFGRYRRVKNLHPDEQVIALRILQKCTAPDTALRRCNNETDELKRTVATRLGFLPELRRLTDNEFMTHIAMRELRLSPEQFDVLSNPWFPGTNTYDLSYFTSANYAVQKYSQVLSFLTRP